MKKILVTILTTALLWGTVSAQTPPAKTNNFTTDMSENKTPPMNCDHIYLTDKGKQKFIGKWTYKKDDTAFIIQLRDTLETRGKITVETLTGGYKYIIDGQSAPGSSIKNILTGSTHGEALTAEISITNSSNKYWNYSPARYMLTYIDTNTLKFELSKKPGEWYSNKNELSFPVDIILRKQ